MARGLDRDKQKMSRDLEDERDCSIFVGDPQVFEVDKIVDMREIKGKTEFCVKWTGYSDEYNEWVAERDITPDLKRQFSIEKKKKEVTKLKQEKAKARVMRQRHGRTAKSSPNLSVLAFTSTPFTVSSTSRNAAARVTRSTEFFGKSLSISMVGESEPKLPKWTKSKEAAHEVAGRGKSVDDNKESGASTSTSAASSNTDECRLEVPEQNAATKVNGKKDTLVSVTLIPNGCTAETTQRKSDQHSFGSMTLAVSESDMDSIQMQSDNAEWGHEVPERNAPTKVNEKKDTLVSVTLMPGGCTAETTQPKSDQHSFGSMTLAVSESDIDSFQMESDTEGNLLGFNDRLEPLFA